MSERMLRLRLRRGDLEETQHKGQDVKDESKAAGTKIRNVVRESTYRPYVELGKLAFKLFDFIISTIVLMMITFEGTSAAPPVET